MIKLNKTLLTSHYIMNSLFIIFLLFSFSSYAKKLTTGEISQAYYKSYNYEKSGNFQDAIKSLQLVYARYPKAYGVNNRLGYLYRLNIQFKNAELHYKNSITALPDSLTPKLGLMQVYIQANKMDEAEKIGYQIISIDFYNYYGNLKFAYLLRMTDKLDLAEKIMTKMLTRYPSDVLFLTEYGLLKYKQNNINKATVIMQEVIILDPENVNARSVLLALEE